MDDTKVKVANAKTIRQANLPNYNRSLSRDVLKRLDPGGINLVWVAIIHEHARGLPVEPHYRCWVMLKVTGQEKPLQAMMDMEMKTFDGMPSVADYKASVAVTQK